MHSSTSAIFRTLFLNRCCLLRANQGISTTSLQQLGLRSSSAFRSYVQPNITTIRANQRPLKPWPLWNPLCKPCIYIFSCRIKLSKMSLWHHSSFILFSVGRQTFNFGLSFWPNFCWSPDPIFLVSFYLSWPAGLNFCLVEDLIFSVVILLSWPALSIQLVSDIVSFMPHHAVLVISIIIQREWWFSVGRVGSLICVCYSDLISVYSLDLYLC